MKRFVTALAVAAAVLLLASEAHAFGKRKCNTCQTVSTCQPAPASCQSVVTVQATQTTPTVTYGQPVVIYSTAPQVNWQPLNWQSSGCQNGRCPTSR